MKIYDCFTFFNEIELLKIRLETLYSVVDKFVLVELEKNHRGENKELVFKNNIDIFEKYLDKIIYVSPKNIPQYKGEGDWSIENFQRESISLGLKECNPDDIIIVSDLDEIPNPNLFLSPDTILYERPKGSIEDRGGKKEVLKYVLHRCKNISIKDWMCIKNNSCCWLELLDKHSFVCELSACYYFMNAKRRKPWVGPTISKFKNLTSPQEMRDNRFIMLHLKNAGWHFSYLGGVEKIKLKLSSIIDSRSSINKRMKRCLEDDDYIMYCIENGLSIYDDKDSPIEKYEFLKPEEVGLPNIDDIYRSYPEFFHVFEQGDSTL